MNKKGAVELSIGTIVIIVLAMSMLILGIMLVQNIFGVGMSLTNILSNELEKEISDMHNRKLRIAMAPSARHKEVTIGSDSGFAFAIANLVSEEASSDIKFSYEVTAQDDNLRQCDLNVREVESWIKSGKTGSGIPIPPAKPFEAIVLLTIPETAPICTVTYLVEVRKDNEVYDTSTMALRLRT